MQHTLSRLAVAAVLCAPLVAQTSRNVTLLSRFDPGGSFNDVWGHVDPATGREFAIFMGSSGTYIVETTDPSNLVQKAFIPGPSSSWRDARTYGGYAYVVTEGGGGMQIVDLRNPDAPVLVKTWSGGLNWRNTHNIALDTQTGVAYPCGTSGGMHMLDLSQDPENPTWIATYTTEYVHDLHIQDGYAYLAEINRGTFRVLDVSNLPAFQALGSTSIRTCHNAWPTRDNRYCVATSERNNEPISIVDIQNRNAPVRIATWKTGSTGALPHNAYVLERVCHASYYSEGYRCLDLTDPNQPVEVGYYDTNSSTSGFSGDWGCYPFQPSGIVYASDMSNGLFVMKPKATTVDYGSATPGTGGQSPTLWAFGAAYLGNARFAFEVEDAVPSANTVLLVGTARRDLTFQGLTLLVDTTIGAVLSGTTDAAGEATFGIAVPNDTNLDGLELHAQAFVSDPSGPLGFSATAGKTFELFQR